MRIRPRYKHSVEIHRGTYGEDGRLEFSGTPEATVSGSVWQSRLKEVVVEGEVITITAQGFLDRSADVRTADHLLLSAPAAVSGQRYEVLLVNSGEDYRGELSHVGVQLRDTTVH